MKFLFCLVFILILSCNSSNRDKSVFIGGNIINPSSKFITIYRGDNIIDSIPLDQKNKFHKSYENLLPGVYKLEHPPQNQSILIEPGDSIWTRVNTSDFDASIAFSGKGAAKNNFLMEVNKQLKSEVSFLSNKYSYNSRKFSKIIDSLLNEKKQNWITFDSLNTLTPLAQKITQSSYIYPYANRRERYSLIRGNNILFNKDSVNYFSFRKYLSLGEEELHTFEPYIKYIMSYLSNLAIRGNQYFSIAKKSTDFNIRRLQIINNQIPSNKLRSTLFRSVAYEELINFDNHLNHKEFINFFSTLENGSENHINEILSLYESIKSMQKGKKLPIIDLEDSNFNRHKSSFIYNNKPTVIYFWSQTQMNYFKNTYDLVLKFKNKFPNYRYIGICLQPLNSIVLDFQNDLGISTENQFAMVDFENGSKKWVLTLLNKGIIIDPKGLIIEGFGVFTSRNFENILKYNHLKY